MEQRMPNPATLIPDAGKALYALAKSTRSTGVPATTMELVHLRVSQVNGCSLCVDAGVKTAKKTGETDERLHTVAAWRETPYFTEPERAALALAEAATRLADRPDPVPDDVWAAAAEHYTHEQLAALVIWIATTNAFNRLNATTRQLAGSVTW
ncbi:alkyl hydroperoxide reductase AhpD [Actinorhabdospora filicis]|uniref:Alkyl hydroperoxide reductase AhpD n=1 Tax=Actinorhabdospora filicis TaxID=1785913 RepID=A0A9W6SMG7_9ACTN|nr:carboxymuconolactone decarboxylase family protein [Actinorhabdospora filicis]GLZ78482.1 alkyl hydroperoxide reductase AhpD [Actinorhabdospora filicis]